MRLASWHRTKIVCTLGPATDAPGVLERLVGAGMDVARINLSHGTHDEHARRIAAVRAAGEAARQPVAVLADLPGPKFRLGAIEEGGRMLVEGTRVALTGAADGSDSLPVRNPELLAALRPGETVFLADGTVELRVAQAGAARALCEVVIGGTVRSGSGINVPDAELGGVVPTPQDRRHLRFALSHAADWIGVSFVQGPDDLERVRAAFPAGASARLMAKIEKRRALARLDDIVEAADGVMVARGDLGVETDLAEIPLVQKRIVAAANARARPVVTATQMLESMIQHEHPTRAEVTDIANAVLDGTDAVMLSGETAVGRHPVAAVEILGRVLAATERACSSPLAASDAVSYAACELAARVGARAIVAHGGDFRAAAGLARVRPAVPIVLLAPSEAACRQLVILRGVAPLFAQGFDAARDWLFGRGLAAPGSEAVVLSAPSPGAPWGQINLTAL